MSAGSISPDELADLRRLGIDPNGPIPENLPDMIARAVEEARRDNENPPPPLPPNTPPLRVDITPIEMLPVAQQQQIRASLHQAMAAASQNNISQNNISQQSVSQSAAPTELDDPTQLQIVNDLDLSRLQPAAVQPQPRVAAPVPAAPPAAPEPVSPAAMSAVSNDNGSIAGIKSCPHCKWDLAITDPIEVSHIDKQRYVISIMGGVPFVKSYELFGGRAEVEFRSANFGELDECYRQASQDMVARCGAVAYEDFVDAFKMYRLVTQLGKLQLSGNIMKFPDAIKKWEFDGEDKSPDLSASPFRGVSLQSDCDPQGSADLKSTRQRWEFQVVGLVRSVRPGTAIKTLR